MVVEIASCPAIPHELAHGLDGAFGQSRSIGPNVDRRSSDRSDRRVGIMAEMARDPVDRGDHIIIHQEDDLADRVTQSQVLSGYDAGLGMM